MSERIDGWKTELHKGIIQLLVFAVLSDRDLHGKGICDTIWRQTNHIVDVPLGTVYPLLRRFIREDLIETYKAEDDLRKTIYRLNKRGLQFYQQMQEMWLRYSAAVSNVLHQ